MDYKLVGRAGPGVSFLVFWFLTTPRYNHLVVGLARNNSAHTLHVAGSQSWQEVHKIPRIMISDFVKYILPDWKWKWPR